MCSSDLIGRGAALAALPEGARPIADGNRVTTERGPLVSEWLVNAPDGIEQGFTIATDPAPGATGDLVLELAIGGDLGARAVLDGPTTLAIPGTSLTWAGLAAWDGAGRSLPARLAIDGDRLRILVDDHAAVYPLTIDPLWSQQAYLKASNTEASDYFGHWVAIAGDTVVVSATSEDSCSTGVGGDASDNACTGAGAVYVFRRTGSLWAQEAYLKADRKSTRLNSSH